MRSADNRFMRFRVIASDFDGTLATHGEMHPSTVAALERVSQSGRLLMLVTGRTMESLRLTCPDVDVFDLIVAENGAVLFTRETGKTTLLADPLPEEFADLCHKHGVPDLHVGQVIAATWDSFRDGVVAAVADVGCPLELSYNKGNLMILPAGVTKATGLAAALDAVGETASATVAFGDAQNDLDFLQMCGCAVAVGNALDAVKDVADIVTTATHGEGAVEVFEALIADDLASFAMERRSATV